MIQTRVHRFKVRGRKLKRDVQGKSSLQRVVGTTNTLPRMIEADTIVAIKRLLNKHMDMKEFELCRNCLASHLAQILRADTVLFNVKRDMA